ncbi:hypothetical protein ES708_11595 [subsurface metagenome]
MAGELKCPACGHPLGFRCKNEGCGNEVMFEDLVEEPTCDMCGGEMELTAFMSDEELEATNEDAKKRGCAMDNLAKLGAALEGLSLAELRLVELFVDFLANEQTGKT